MLVFFDTNILVTLFDQDVPDKRDRAKMLFQQEVEAGRFVASTQVLQEFYVAATRKLAVPLPVADAEEAVRALADLSIVPVDSSMILSAIDRSRSMQVSFWDALIIEAALSVGATCLLTEDLQHGRQIDGLRITNPFLK
ncbi:MAG: PIN domain-containing protein [Desulfuromonadales bacterium]